MHKPLLALGLQRFVLLAAFVYLEKVSALERQRFIHANVVGILLVHLILTQISAIMSLILNKDHFHKRSYISLMALVPIRYRKLSIR